MLVAIVVGATVSIVVGAIFAIVVGAIVGATVGIVVGATVTIVVGAALKGPFSRYDYQRNSGVSSVKGFTTLLPAAAQDLYYRDEIGNISTSNARSEEDFVSLEIRPR